MEHNGYSARRLLYLSLIIHIPFGNSTCPYVVPNVSKNQDTCTFTPPLVIHSVIKANLRHVGTFSHGTFTQLHSTLTKDFLRCTRKTDTTCHPFNRPIDCLQVWRHLLMLIRGHTLIEHDLRQCLSIIFCDALEKIFRPPPNSLPWLYIVSFVNKIAISMHL